MMTETVTFYRDHPYACRLVFGSDHSWKIREADIANNLTMALMLEQAIGHRFKKPPGLERADFFSIGIGLADAVWSLSVARHNTITDAYSKQAEIAVLAYLSESEMS